MSAIELIRLGKTCTDFQSCLDLLTWQSKRIEQCFSFDIKGNWFLEKKEAYSYLHKLTQTCMSLDETQSWRTFETILIGWETRRLAQIVHTWNWGIFIDVLNKLETTMATKFLPEGCIWQKLCSFKKSLWIGRGKKIQKKVLGILWNPLY